MEYDPNEYADEVAQNPGFGPVAGKVEKARCKPGPEIFWIDNKHNGPVDSKFLVWVPKPGQETAVKGKYYTVLAYKATGGVCVRVSNTSNTPKKPRTTAAAADGAGEEDDGGETRRMAMIAAADGEAAAGDC